MIENGKIVVLEDIQVDETLPKHSKAKKNNLNINIDGFNVSTESGFNSVISSGRATDISLEYLQYQYNTTRSLYIKFKIWLYKRMYGHIFNVNILPEKRTITPLDLKVFFDRMKTSMSELDHSNINEIISRYDTVLLNAVNNKQIALREKIEAYADVLKCEMILSVSCFNKFLEERDVVQFYEKASKHNKYKTNLCLTYIKNFIKIIPEEISELKLKADELKVFDNYVILHYDYNGNAVADTNAEAIKKKDPILFGVIRNSKKLYYIGDWVDDYCDLTLDVIIKKLGIKKTELDKKTIINGLS